MFIDPTTIDAYIARKGLVPRVTDAEWQAVLQRIVSTFGRELWHRCRLVHQTDEALGRFSTVFPDAVPQPYRHLRELEILAHESPELRELQAWLTARGIAWRIRRERDVETDREEIVGLRLFGFEADVSTD